MVLIELFYTFFIISAFSIGGGYAMIPLIESQVVAQGFLTSAQVSDIIAISEMTPGPFAINSATFAGVKAAGILGGIVTTLAVVTPSLFYANIVGKYYYKLKGGYTFEYILKSIKPISIALIVSAVLSLAYSSVSEGIWTLPFDFFAVIIGTIAFLMIYKFKLSPLICLFASGVLGVIIYSIF